MLNHPPFATARERDAWFTIRGFVRQVDQSIIEWLTLPADETLELERGEDIDRIVRALALDGSETYLRTLEQVKQRQKSITLRSPEAREAIAGFVEHKTQNPGQRLQFRFITNAPVGRERPSPYPDKTPALTRWEQLRQNNQDGSRPISAAETVSWLGGIRLLLTTAMQPDGLDDDTWAGLLKFLSGEGAGDPGLLELVRGFTWDTHGPKAEAMAGQIRALLQKQGRTQTENDAQAMYERLFVSVFTLLTRPGIKRLTARECDLLLATPPLLSLKDQELWNKLEKRVFALEGRVAVLEERTERVEQLVGSHAEALQAVGDWVGALARAQGVEIVALRHAAETLILDVPPPMEPLVERPDTVSLLNTQMTSAAWTAIHGGIGWGKTELIAQIARRRETCRLWVRLRYLSPLQAAERLDRAGASILGNVTPSELPADGYGALCRSLGTGALVVLDDLPRLTAGDELTQRLSLLARACRAHGVFLITTGPDVIPLSVRQSIPVGTLEQIQTPPFTAEETANLFHAYGMPNAEGKAEDAQARRLVAFAQTLCHGHPLLLTSFAAYLGERNWHLSDSDLVALGQADEYASELNADTVARLIATVGEEHSRELLYRLNLVIGTFSAATVNLLANVTPPVERPRERLHSLTGMWLQRDSTDRLAVSPLVKALGNDELAPEIRRQCWVVLGEEVARRHQVSTADVSVGMTYFTQAEAFEQAGVLLLVALNAMREAGVPSNPGLILSWWWDTPLPEAIPLGIRIYLRAMQIAVGIPLGRDPARPASELGSLVQRASPNEAWALLGAVALAASQLSRINFAAACLLIQRTIELFPQARLDDGRPLIEELELPSGFKPEWFLWWITDAIETPADLNAWLDLAAILPPEVRPRVFEGDLAEGGCLAVVNRLWLRENAKPESERQWRDVDTLLETVATEARTRIGSELLWACAIRAQVIVRGECEGHVEEGLAHAETALNSLEPPTDPRALYLLEEETGRLLLRDGRREAARLWLDRALTHPVEGFRHQWMTTLLHAAKAADDPKVAVRRSEEAVSLVVPDGTSDTNTHYDLAFLPSTERVRALGELAMAHGEAGDQNGAFLAAERAAAFLLDEPNEGSSEWREAAILLGHLLGHLLAVASPPAKMPEGVEVPELRTAFRGMFLIYDDRNAAPYGPGLTGLISSTLADLAELVGEDERAGEWALRAVDLARATGSGAVLAVALQHAISPLVSSDQYGDAIDAARESVMTAYAMAHSIRTRLPNASRTMLPAEANEIEALWRQLPPEKQRESNDSVAVIGLVPAFFRIATIALIDTERATRLATEMASACRIIGESGGPDSEMWMVSARVITKIFARQSAVGDLVTYGNSFKGKYEDVLQLICYFGATIQFTARPEEAVAIQARTLGFLLMYRNTAPGSYRQFLIPFFFAFWRDTYARSRVRFTPPHLFEQQIELAQALSDDQQVETLVAAAAARLNISIPRRAGTL